MSEYEPIEGLWWVRGPDQGPVSGILQTTPKLKLRFFLPKNDTTITSGKFPSMEDREASRMDVLHGVDGQGHPITLFQCKMILHERTNAQQAFEIDALTGIRGLKLDSWKEPSIRVASLDVENLARWCGWTLYGMRGHPPSQSLAFEIDQVREIICPLDHGLEFRIERGVHISPKMDSLQVSPIERIHLRFDQAQSPADIRLKWLPWVSQLMSLLFGTSVWIKNVQLHALDCFSPEYDPYSSPPQGTFMATFPKPRQIRISDPLPHDMVAPYPEITDIFPAVVKKWQEKHEQLEPVVSLFSSVALHHNLYDKAQFLFLVQALEIYHTLSDQFISTELPKEERDVRLARALEALPGDLHGWARGKLCLNNKSLSKKLLDIFEAHGDESRRMFGEDLQHAAKRIAYTRNHFTHHHEDVKQSYLLPNIQISPISWRLEALLWVILLREIGIDGQPVRRILHRATSAQFISLRS